MTSLNVGDSLVGVSGGTFSIQAAPSNGYIYMANSGSATGWSQKNTTDFVSSISTQSPNQILVGPTSGASAAPTFRALVPGDIPNLSGYLQLPTAYTTVSSPAFSTPRTPSSTRPTLVTANVQMTLTLIQTSTINAQVNTGSGYVTIQSRSLSLLGTTSIDSFSFWVPSGASYQLTTIGGTTAINSILEMTF